MANSRDRRRFGQIAKLPSGRYRARYADPQGRMVPPTPKAIEKAAREGKEPRTEPLRHAAPHTFDTLEDAQAWLTDERRLISAGVWTPPADRAAAKVAQSDELTFGTYGAACLRDRDLKPRTRQHYNRIFERFLLPTFGPVALTAITPAAVRQWHALTATSTPTTRAHAYGLLRTIMAQAESDGLITRSPVHIRKAGNAERVHEVKPLTVNEIASLVAAMPENRQVMTLMAAWLGLRFGELTELRRKDIDLSAQVVTVRRAVVRVNGQTIVGRPKSKAGTRTVAIPPHLVPAIRDHLDQIPAGAETLLFPGADGGHLAPSTLYGRAPTDRKAGWGFYAARVAIGRPTLRWHDLRHSSAVLAAQTGATLAELMGRLGHSTQTAALRYQHMADERDKEIARQLSAMAGKSIDVS